MKKSLIFKNLIALVLISNTVFFASCVKNRNDGAVDFSQLTPIMQITEGGLNKNFAAAALVFPATDISDSAFFTVNYAAVNVAPADIKVTLAIDPAALAAYNAANPTGQYVIMPANLYDFTTTSVTVKAGQSYSDFIKFTVHPYLANPSISYMLPISITDASGTKISGNFGTIYYHIIGNPLAGNYQDYGQRFNFTGSVPWTGPVAGLALATAPGVPSSNPPAGNTGITTYNMIVGWGPVNSATVTATMGNVPDPVGGLAYYFVTGTDPVFSNITYDLESTFYTGYSNVDRFVRGYRPPSPTQKAAFRLITHYNNSTGGSGNDRIIDETFIQQ